MASARKIYVRDYEIWLEVGVYPYEKQGPQKIMIDVEINLCEAKDPFADELSQTLDYDWITQTLRHIADGDRCKLLETVGERFIVEALKQPLVEAVKIVLAKPGVSEMGEHRGVELTRTR